MSGIIKRTIAFLLVSSLALFFTGCNSEGGFLGIVKKNSSNSSEKYVQLKNISLPLDYTDSINPYKATTVANRYIFPLMYDSLFKLDKHFNAQKYMVKDYEQNEYEFKFNLKDGLIFTDGTSVSTYDVQYSLNLAKSSPLYSEQLKNIDSIECDSQTVLITLKTPDINFANCLDVPIVKTGSAGSSSAPVGSGRYKIKKEGSQYTLVYNKKHFLGKTPHFKTITLAKVPDSESIMNSVKTGQVHAMFSDLRDGETGGVDAKTIDVSLNNMVYIGINAKGTLADSRIRRAISFALKRNVILSKGYSSRGIASYLPINPLFDYNADIKMPAYNINKASSLLVKAGYEKTNLRGIRLKNSRALKLTLLVNSDNNYKLLTASAVKSALQDVGIDIKIVKVKSVEKLKERIYSGDFQLYLGETRLLNNMDISGFFKSGILSQGIKNKQKLLKSYEKYLKTGDITGFADDFFEEMPFIPLLFRSGIVAYNSNISTPLVSTPSDIYDNILDWK